jgi:hypothetical protein
MGLKAHTEIQGDLLVVTVTGTVDLKASVRILKRICDAVAEKKLQKIFVSVLAVKGTLSTIERYNLAAQVSAYIRQLQINPRFAFVGLPPLADGFAVQVAQNRDIAVELFSTVDKALQWLDKWPTQS